MKKILLFSITMIGLCAAKAQSPNWSQDVAPILYSNCTKCHNPNGVAPFPLITYMDAYAQSLPMQNAVVNHIMPPWPPDPSYRRLAHERVLTAAQIKTIDDWVKGGSPMGDTNLAPPKPFYSGMAEITSPDLSAQIPSYTVGATQDIYRCFVIPSGLSVQKYITQMEVLPGNRNIVHHILVYQDTSSKPAQLDAADPGPGYTNFGGTGSMSSVLIGAWVPGSSVYKLPAGMGIQLGANTNIILQIHYPAGSFNQNDSTRINFKLAAGPLRNVSISPVLNHYQLDQGFLSIPANTIKTFTAHIQLPFDYSLLSVGPHMHLIGKSISSWAVTPANTTIPFISIPSWDFHWQGSYEFQTVQKLTAGTTLYSSATYDNTSSNYNNPNNPPKTVTLGEKTTDEMMLIYLAYTPYMPGDENIILDSSIITNSVPETSSGKEDAILLDPFPNPFSSQLAIQFYLPKREEAQLTVYDLNGRLIFPQAETKLYDSGLHTVYLDPAALSQGVYFVRLKTKDGVYIKKLVKA